MNANTISLAQGCLLGQLVGDSLGSLVEFQTPKQILQKYPDGVQELIDGGTWNTLAGQPTDDSEMALLLARLLIKEETYNPIHALQEYQYWISSNPFDCGMTIAKGLSGQPDAQSQANGALMRISPLGIFGAKHNLNQVAQWAMQDAELTHPHHICQQVNALFTMAIAHAIATGCSPKELYDNVGQWANKLSVDPLIIDIIKKSSTSPPKDYVQLQGWVLIAFQNALYQLINAKTLAEGVINTVMQGGDTDTNAAICGALLGAVYGRKAIPRQWAEAVLNCRPKENEVNVKHPRPEAFWPVDALVLAEKLAR